MADSAAQRGSEETRHRRARGFDAQLPHLRRAIPELSSSKSFPISLPKLAVEAGAPLCWWKYVGRHGDVIGLERFGASSPGPKVLEELGFSVENITKRAKQLLEGGRDRGRQGIIGWPVAQIPLPGPGPEIRSQIASLNWYRSEALTWRR